MYWYKPIRRMLRDVLQVIFRRTTGRTDRGRTTTTGRTDGQWTDDDDDGRTWTDGQRTDDDDGTDDGTDGRTDGERTTTTTGHDGTRRDGRREYPIFTKKYIDGLPPKTDTHKRFWTSNRILEPVRIFYTIYTFVLFS